MDDLLEEFIAETRETLDALGGEIVGWEAAPGDRARLDAIFRFVHTIKGSCGFLDLPRLARLSHAAENALAAVRSGERTPDAALVNAILAIIDRIAELVEAIAAGDPLDDDDEDHLIAMLDPDSGSVTPIARAAFHAAAGQAPVRSAMRSVRLSVDLLDQMMGSVSDMVLARNLLARQVRLAGDQQSEALLQRLSLTVDSLRDIVTRTRMQRIESLFAALPRVVRDTAAALGKQVTLTIEGGDVELDREMVESLRDPLIHLVRNAIDHGIEGRADRVLTGKPAAGSLRIVARQAGNLIIIEVCDDGRGIDTDRVVAKIARDDPARGAALMKLGDQARAALILEPGFSSRDTVSEISGRGVGMDVVRSNVEQIGGRLSLSNRPGRGLTVALEVPLTLAIINIVMVETIAGRFAVPRQSIEEIVSVGQEDTRVEQLAGATIARVRGALLPMVDLGRMFGVPATEPSPLIAVIALRDGRFALPLTRVVDMQELVVKPAAPAVMGAGIYAGQMLPDDGRPILLLDCAGIAQRAGLRFVAAQVEREEEAGTEPVRALMFVDSDGVRRLIAADAIDRIETVSPGSVRSTAAGLRVMLDGHPVALFDGFGVDPATVTTVLRVHVDSRIVGYPVREALDIVDLPEDIAPVDAGMIAGIAVIDGDPVELIDPLRLSLAADVPVADRPLCLLHGAESAWMEAFLNPAVEAAGYRVVRSLLRGEQAAVALAVEDDATSAPAPAIRLGRTRGEGVYRYDRAAVIAALREYC